MAGDKHLFKIVCWDGDQDLYVAKDHDHLMELAEVDFGPDFPNGFEISQYPDEETVTISFEGEDREVDHEDSRPAARWAEDSEVGFLAGTPR